MNWPDLIDLLQGLDLTYLNLTSNLRLACDLNMCHSSGALSVWIRCSRKVWTGIATASLACSTLEITFSAPMSQNI